MKVVVDANVVISILMAKGSKHKLFFSNELELLSPDIVLFEIGKYWKDISERSRLSERELDIEFSTVREQINVIPSGRLLEWIKKGAEVSPDPDDAEYFALALKFNCLIWSEDRLLAKQHVVEVLNTRDLLKKLGLISE